jgi:hypothetical protein
LSAMGIMMALMSGVSCANTVSRCEKKVDEVGKHLRAYASGLEVFFQESFLPVQKTYYMSETRFPGEEFWERRK